MQLVLQYSYEYATDLENDTPDIVLQVTPRRESPPTRSRRCNEDQPQIITASTDKGESTVSGIAPPILRNHPRQTTADGTPIRLGSGDEAGPSSAVLSIGTSSNDSPSVATPSDSSYRSPSRRSVTFNLPLPTSFSTSDDSDNSDIDSVENRSTYTQVPLMPEWRK